MCELSPTTVLVIQLVNYFEWHITKHKKCANVTRTNDPRNTDGCFTVMSPAHQTPINSVLFMITRFKGMLCNVRKERNFYLTMHSTHFIYGYMVKDHSDSERGNPLPTHPNDRITHITAVVTPVVEHWLKREIAQ